MSKLMLVKKQRQAVKCVKLCEMLVNRLSSQTVMREHSRPRPYKQLSVVGGALCVTDAEICDKICDR